MSIDDTGKATTAATAFAAIDTERADLAKLFLWNVATSEDGNGFDQVCGDPGLV